MPESSYEPHLTLKTVSVSPGGEWLPKSPGWSLLQIKEGNAYWLHAQSSVELESGMALLVADNVRGRIRASQLNGASLFAFSVTPSRFSGLMTGGEQDFLKQAAAKAEFAFQIFPAQHPVALKMKEVGKATGNLASRLALLQIFIEAFGAELNQPVADPKKNADARERLRNFLRDQPPSALLEISFTELARTTHCTPRHLSRIFCELTGMTFREKRAEIRLARARELLVNSKSKIVEVALESGFKSLSLFNLMFSRRFGLSPGRWRLKHSNLPRRRKNESRFAGINN